MAITDTTHDAALIPRFFGLSTDTKPVSAMVGATFHETDTRKAFVYDGVEWLREKTVVVEQVGTVAVQEALPSELLAEILTQLKIQNAHLSVVTGETLDETDIPAEVR